jgi:hypothetical protein
MSGDPVDDEEPAATVADRMADAVSYLSVVARDAGLDSISADLLSIRRKLKDKARTRRPRGRDSTLEPSERKLRGQGP